MIVLGEWLLGLVCLNNYIILISFAILGILVFSVLDHDINRVWISFTYLGLLKWKKCLNRLGMNHTSRLLLLFID